VEDCFQLNVNKDYCTKIHLDLFLNSIKEFFRSRIVSLLSRRLDETPAKFPEWHCNGP